ncbi:hypothetical protein EUTSA_v10009142mg [Eutrema salsugineum]|uniref:Uncharacterized protein n=1 Tax=Eutrema salsugineum TaxID=72664 RepID=V4KRV1_EUTSA|nr:uncharacterized protein LOC18992212 [Eutrema salsugineum]ESQ33999.1 hypothetical protein EUTSA_v10009142mg [Eutrema salsugineum]
MDVPPKPFNTKNAPKRYQICCGVSHKSSDYSFLRMRDDRDFKPSSWTSSIDNDLASSSKLRIPNKRKAMKNKRKNKKLAKITKKEMKKRENKLVEVKEKKKKKNKKLVEVNPNATT